MSELDEVIERAVDRALAKRPRPTQVTQAQAAEMLGLHRHTVAKLIAAGSLRLNRCGMIPIEQVDSIRATHEGRRRA